MALADVRKELDFCRKGGLPVLGVVENMSGYTCPCCGEVTHVFARGGGEALARVFGIPFMGRVPMDPALCAAMEAGVDIFTTHPTAPVTKALDAVAAQLAAL